MVIKRKEPHDLAVRLFPRPPTYEEERYAFMIRGFSLLCKINFNHYSTLALFYHCMRMIDIRNCPCPKCGTRHPDWDEHATYIRYLIGFEKGDVVCDSVEITRFKCPSCGTTHGILPEFVIPFKSHSLFFVLAVMKDYFMGLKIADISAKYEISVSTLYAWKDLFLKHKRMWLGVLEDTLTSTEQFLTFLRNGGLKRRLHEFFAATNRSFFQGCGNPPRSGRFMPD